MIIFYSPKFAREYKKLPEEVKDTAEIKETIFRKDPYDPRLKTHKLSGEFEGFLSFSINYSYRIIFDFADKNTVRFYRIGTHDIYE
ncbi:MAG: type II toxin-antitoxin system mRNA interferase toxin, RelE/StbE family [Candidatus Parcubacteria bacterium]|nr:type II toxin-antitoxin system mRNA interferase toxin, RelE/StbE family [Candidatus Parcubacteria bacterium]